MNGQADILSNFVSEALTAGDEQAPAALIQAMELQPDAHEVLTSLDPPPEPFEALETDAPGCGKLRSAPGALNGEERRTIVRLLRWALRELSVWTPQADPHGKSFAAIFVVFNSFGFREEHWNLVPNDRAKNSNVLQRLVGLMKSATVTMSAGPGRGHARERGIVDTVASADVQEDWVLLENNWRLVRDYLLGSMLFSQGVLYTARYGPDELRSVVDQVPQMSVAWLVAREMPPQERFSLAHESPSQRFKLAAVLAVDWSELENGELPASASGALTRLLVGVSQNPTQWRAWMKIFNEHPTRFPWLQTPLGNALSCTPEEARIAYVDSIKLSPLPFGSVGPSAGHRRDSRTCVGVCLHHFRATASEDSRKSLWARAHQRWEAWDFGKGERRLMWPHCSELDYALVSYARENLSPDERTARIQARLCRLTDLETGWYASVTDMIHARNCLFSQLQPLLAAEQDPWTDSSYLIGSPLVPPSYVESEYDRLRWRP